MEKQQARCFAVILTSEGIERLGRLLKPPQLKEYSSVENLHLSVRPEDGVDIKHLERFVLLAGLVEGDH
ncbi:hypothetical protein CYR75_04410 [Paracoccus jeotgali]|uniref:Uncharacterized protein n=1 Tax=Paracoccus jeotgali TaxID=2065379 RepID=A0A2K9MDD3_9RHOB|nr:hypothetical protein CYR75_04410 [Paracoccus jeotgali]